MPWKSISSGLQLHEDNKHWFWVTSLPTGTLPKKIENFKRKEEEEEKTIHKNFSKFYPFDIYVTFG